MMRIRVMVFRHVVVPRLGEVTDPSSDPDGRRKFMLMGRDDEMVLLLGPILNDPDAYVHRDVLHSAYEVERSLRTSSVKGGGYITVFGQFDRSKRIIRFHGKSQEFGAFASQLAEEAVCKQLEEVLGLSVLVDLPKPKS